MNLTFFSLPAANFKILRSNFLVSVPVSWVEHHYRLSMDRENIASSYLFISVTKCERKMIKGQTPLGSQCFGVFLFDCTWLFCFWAYACWGRTPLLVTFGSKVFRKNWKRLKKEPEIRHSTKEHASFYGLIFSNYAQPRIPQCCFIMPSIMNSQINWCTEECKTLIVQLYPNSPTFKHYIED